MILHMPQSSLDAIVHIYSIRLEDIATVYMHREACLTSTYREGIRAAEVVSSLVPYQYAYAT